MPLKLSDDLKALVRAGPDDIELQVDLALSHGRVASAAREITPSISREELAR